MSTTRKPRRWVKMFRNRYEQQIIAGTKRQTIRPIPKDDRYRPKRGDTIDCRLWTGKPYRSKQRSIASGTIINVVEIAIHDRGVMLENRIPLDLDSFARADGFKDWEDMRSTFAEMHGLPFQGLMIQWQLDQR